jgi:hypothetical protein
VFNAITNMEGSAAQRPEIAARNEEKMTQLGPVIERVNNEKLQVAIDRTFGIMSRLGIIPPAPEQLQGKNAEDRFRVDPHPDAADGWPRQTERVTSYIGNLAAAFPEAADKLNVDEAIDDYADRAGSPPKIIRSDDDVGRCGNPASKQQQAQAMAAAMPAVKDGADAAGCLSEAAQNGGGIQNLVGGPGQLLILLRRSRLEA